MAKVHNDWPFKDKDNARLQAAAAGSCTMAYSLDLEQVSMLHEVTSYPCPFASRTVRDTEDAGPAAVCTILRLYDDDELLPTSIQ